jgi:hypothetical protein
LTYVGGVALDLGGQIPTTHINLSLAAGPDDRIEDQWLVGQPADVLGETLLDTIDTAKLIGGRITTSSAPCPGVTGGGLYGFVKSKRVLGINYGSFELIPARLVASVSYPVELLGSSFAFPFLSLSVENATTFCLPSLTGRVTVAENAVRLSLAPDALTPVDREIVVKNVTRNTAVHYPRDVTEYTLTVDGDEADKFEVRLIDVAGSEHLFSQFRQNAGTAGSVGIGIKPGQLLPGDKSISIQNTTRQSSFQSRLPSRSAFTVEGLTADAFTVAVTDTQGAVRTIPASGFEVAAGSTGSVVIRLNADQIKVVVAEIRIRNITKGSESRLPQRLAAVKFSVAGAATDTYEVVAVDINGLTRQLAPTVLAPPPPLNAGNLVVRALPYSIDPTKA